MPHVNAKPLARKRKQKPRPGKNYEWIGKPFKKSNPKNRQNIKVKHRRHKKSK